MLANMDELVFTDRGNHAEFVLRGLDESRRTLPTSCDFAIVCEAQRFPCHRSVLCLFSEYFRSAIVGGFKEKLENEVVIQDVSSTDVATLLDFAYTGTLKLNHGNVENLLSAATRLRFSKVVTRCVDYIRHQIDETNCFEILTLAQEQKHPALEESARQFLVDNLCSVFKFEDTLAAISPGHVTEILQDPQTHKRGEECVALALLTWLETDVTQRREHAGNLLDHVMWRRLPAPFLLKVLLRHPIITSDTSIKELVLDHVRRSYDDVSSKAEMTSVLGGDDTDRRTPRRSQSSDSTSSLTPNYRNFRPRKALHQAMLLVGGLTLGEAERGDTTQPNVMCYHTIERAWKRRASWPERGLRGFSVSKYNDGVAVTGGCSTTIKKHLIINRAWYYDVLHDQWTRLSDMNKTRSFHGTCELNSLLYAVGGSVVNVLDAEFYDRCKGLWTSVKQPAPRMMDNFTVSACNSKLMLLGSGLPSTVFIQCYNPAVDSWTVLRSPYVPRHLSAPVSGASFDGNRIYIGGDNTKKMYVYHPNTNTWTRAADMNNLHSNGNLVLIGQEVFMTGGHWEDDGYWDEMESYDPVKDVWTAQGALPHLWLYHGCATVYVDD